MMKKINIIVAYYKYCFITYIEYLEYTYRIYIFSKQKLIVAIKRKKKQSHLYKIILT